MLAQAKLVVRRLRGLLRAAGRHRLEAAHAGQALQSIDGDRQAVARRQLNREDDGDDPALSDRTPFVGPVATRVGLSQVLHSAA